MPTAIRSCCMTLTTVAVLAGCATPGAPLESRLDMNTGVTVMTLDRVIVLARPIPRLATAARDYAYLGPVEINRMGAREHYLWVGMSSTLDRRFFGETPPDTTTLHLVVDGEPMTLSLSAWHDDIDTPPYAVGTPVHEHLRARVSLNQLRRIANADTVDVHIAAGDATSGHYRLWDGLWSELADFTTEVRVAPQKSADAQLGNDE